MGKASRRCDRTDDVNSIMLRCAADPRHTERCFRDLAKALRSAVCNIPDLEVRCLYAGDDFGRLLTQVFALYDEAEAQAHLLAHGHSPEGVQANG